MSSFIHPRVIPNMHDFLSFEQQKLFFVHTMKVKGIVHPQAIQDVDEFVFIQTDLEKFSIT